MAEDDASVRRVIVATLERAGYTVLVACNGREAVELALVTDRIDMIVSDIVMPVMDGIQAVSEIRERRPGLPVLLVSGHSRDLPRQELSSDICVLAKPFTSQRLTARVREIIDG